MLQITAIENLVLISDASAVGANINGDLVAIVAVASVVGVIVLWSLIGRYQRAIASNRVRAVQDLEERYKQCNSRAEALLARAKLERRDFSPIEAHEFVHLMDKYDDLQLELKRAKERMPSEEPPLIPPRPFHQPSSRPTSYIEGLLLLQLIATSYPWDRHRHDR